MQTNSLGNFFHRGVAPFEMVFDRVMNVYKFTPSNLQALNMLQIMLKSETGDS